MASPRVPCGKGVNGAMRRAAIAALVAVFDLGYMPVWRRGLHLYLSESGAHDSGIVQIDEIDFGDSRVVHLVWMNIGLQFEWVIP